MKQLGILVCALLLASCTYNPFIANNHLTGSPTAGLIGAAAAGETIASLGGSKTLVIVSSVAGGMFGYYITTLRADAADIIALGGTVYKVGDKIGIYLPTDKIFEPNTAVLLPFARPALASAARILQRYPGNNILISGNTSGFYRAGYEQRLSEKRAKVIAAYLWRMGVNNFINQSTNFRKLQYTGYGDYFPISANITNNGIRSNSRIQISSYPSCVDLHLDRRHVALYNMGRDSDEAMLAAPRAPLCTNYNDAGDCVTPGWSAH